MHATQYTALQLIESAPNLTTTELAEAMGIDQTTATRTLALLKRSGLATDTVGENRRQRCWNLTSKGKEQLRKMKPRWEAAESTSKRLKTSMGTPAWAFRTSELPSELPRKSADGLMRGDMP